PSRAFMRSSIQAAAFGHSAVGAAYAPRTTARRAWTPSANAVGEGAGGLSNPGAVHSPVDHPVDYQRGGAEDPLEAAGEHRRVEKGHDVVLDESAGVHLASGLRSQPALERR